MQSAWHNGRVGRGSYRRVQVSLAGMGAIGDTGRATKALTTLLILGYRAGRSSDPRGGTCCIYLISQSCGAPAQDGQGDKQPCWT